MKLLLTIVALLAGLFFLHHHDWRTPDSEPAVPRLVDAAEQGNITRIEQLLRTEPAVDVRDFCLWTPLMKAALNGHLEAAERLLQAGAAVDLEDKGGYTALMLAASNNHSAVVSLLLDQGADPDRVEETQGLTALIWAAKLGHTESVRVLLSRGASASKVDLQGRSARDWALANGHSGIVELLSAAK